MQTMQSLTSWPCESSTLVFVDDDGIQRQVEVNERYYLPTEITWLLKSLGYRKG